MSKLGEIIAGWKNYTVPNPVTERLAKQRSKICSVCPEADKGGILVRVMKDESLEEIQGYVCTACTPNCPLSTKIRSEDTVCELSKW